tara:strand:- start:115 stop:1008 length:894 start_codon:yes stop_codon:yes gene_type:complete
MTANVTAIILTNNEEKHLERCILSLKNIIKRIVVIDSLSTDKTHEILKNHNIEFFQKEWVNYSSQLNWGIEKAEVKTDWILRIDPDEIPSQSFTNNIKNYLDKLPINVSGISITRRLIFLEKEIKFGGDFPQMDVRLWRNGKGKCENTWSDEHMIIDGLIENSNLDIIDNNINNITWWTDKHNRFAIREMIEFFSQKERVKEKNHFKLSKKTEKMKNIKFKIYYRFPMFLRALVFFIYKYLLRLGFLGGWQGFIWCFLQSFWYRILVDVKILEIRNIMKKNNFTFKEAIKKEYGVEI